MRRLRGIIQGNRERAVRTSAIVSLIVLLLLGSVTFASCSDEPSESDIQSSVAETVTALLALTPTPTPTVTPLPTPTQTPLPCSAQAADLLYQIDKIIELWAPVNSSARHLPNIELSEPISTLQQIRIRTAELEAPECATDELEQLLSYMDSRIESYQARMDQDGVRKAVYGHLANYQKETFLEALDSLDSADEDAKTQLYYYAFNYASGRKAITYWEGGRRRIVSEILPWSVGIEAEEGERISFWAEDSLICVILADGIIVDMQEGQTPHCSASME